MGKRKQLQRSAAENHEIPFQLPEARSASPASKYVYTQRVFKPHLMNHSLAHSLSVCEGSSANRYLRQITNLSVPRQNQDESASRNML